MSKVSMDIYVNVYYDEVIKLHQHNGEITKYVLRHHQHRCEVINREKKLFMPYASAISIITVMNWKYVKHNVYDSLGLGEGITYDYVFQSDDSEDTDKELKVEYVIRSIEPVSEEDKKKLWKWGDDKWKSEFYFDDDGHIHSID